MTHSGAMLDTSVWVAVFEGEAAADGLEASQGDLQTVSSPVVLAELQSLTRRGRLKGATPVDTVLEIARIEEFTVEDAVEGGALHGRLRSKGHDKVALGDCLIYATARRVGALLITTDTDLAKEPDVLVLQQKKTKRR